jgi:hypothetical protein
VESREERTWTAGATVAACAAERLRWDREMWNRGSPAGGN